MKIFLQILWTRENWLNFGSRVHRLGVVCMVYWNAENTVITADLLSRHIPLPSQCMMFSRMTNSQVKHKHFVDWDAVNQMWNADSASQPVCHLNSPCIIKLLRIKTRKYTHPQRAHCSSMRRGWWVSRHVCIVVANVQRVRLHCRQMHCHRAASNVEGVHVGLHAVFTIR